MRRSVLLLAGFTLAHFIASICILALNYAVGMSRFDSGAAPGVAERVLDAVAQLLAAPLVPLVAALPRGFQPTHAPWEHLVFLANSALWASVLAWGVHRWRQHRTRGGERVNAGV